jgi:diadenosine tetraphosphate (Ap4A) HIT family hydrolase
MAGHVVSGVVNFNRNEHTVAFLDAFPVVPGQHTLVVPKEYHRSIKDFSTDGLDVLSVLPFIVGSVRTMTGADGINVWQNNGKAAGQHVDHITSISFRVFPVTLFFDTLLPGNLI